MPETRNTLASNVRGAAIALLNGNLALALDLQLQSKQAHWNVKGPNFTGLHALFDQVATLSQGWADEIAERAVALGGIAAGTSQAIVGATRLPAYDVTLQSGFGHVAALAEALALFGDSVRTAIDAATELGDADTADLFTGISGEADKQLWMVEAHLGPA